MPEAHLPGRPDSVHQCGPQDQTIKTERFNTGSLRALGSLSELTHLSVKFNSCVKKDVILKICHGCLKLEELDISGCVDQNLRNVDSAIEAVARLKHLERLKLNYVLIYDVALENVGKHCKGLRLLECNGCPNITHRGVASVLARCTRLETLDLSGCYITNEVVTDATLAVGARKEKIKLTLYLGGQPSTLEDTTNPDWVPSLNLGHPHGNSGVKLAKQVDRHKRQTARRDKREDMELQSQISIKMFTSQGTQTELTHENISIMEDQCNHMEKLNIEVKNLNTNLYEQREFVKTLSLTKEGFEGKDDKTLYYTGLVRFSLLHIIYTAVEAHIPDRKSLTKFQQVLIFLMRMRLYLGYTDLSYRFGVSKSTILNVFNNILEIFFGTFYHMVYWPQRHELERTMPLKYQMAFGKRVSVIVDCFEIFSNSPTSLEAHCMAFSNYKKHVTAKFLIGITPQGSVAFVSQGYGGRLSDKYITEDCGILDRLLPGDIVLSDRGFNIADVASVFCCTVKMPPFKRGRNQLDAAEIDEGRKVSRLRIDVERVIGTLRNKYRIVEGTLKTHTLKRDKSGLAQIDKIVHVACALFNHCPPIVE